MGRRGPHQQQKCIAGHNIADEKNVAIVNRRKGDKVYPERQCAICKRRRARESWHRAKNKKAA